jgi:WD40 repeat protein
LKGNQAICLAFSESDLYLVVLRNDEFHSMLVYDWKNESLVTSTSVGFQPVFAVLCSSSSSFSSASSTLDSLYITTVGLNHCRFWKRVTSSFIYSISPDLSELNSSPNFLCCEVIPSNNHVLAGTDDGFLCIFINFSLNQKMKAHSGAVTALNYQENSKILFSGGEDGVVRQWNSKLECLREYDISQFSKTPVSSVNAIAVSNSTNVLAAGTFGGEIIELDLRKGNITNEFSCTRGHCNLLKGLAVHPHNGQFVTSSDDAVLRIWSAKNCSHVKSLRLDAPSRAVTFSNDGQYLAIGFGNGNKIKGKPHPKEGCIAVLLYDNNLKIVYEKKDANSPVLCLKFSPDNKILAAGCDDCCIYLYDVEDSFLLKSIVRSHSAPLKSIDFVIASPCMVSVDDGNTICFTSLPLGLQQNPKDYVSSPLLDEAIQISWATRGLWMIQPSDEGRQLTTVARSRSYPLIVGGNSTGQIFLTDFPCTNTSGFITAECHAGEVSQIRWISPDNQSFLTCGSRDCVVLQWRLSKIDVPPALSHTVLSSIFEDISPLQSLPSFSPDDSIEWKSMISMSTAAVSRNTPLRLQHLDFLDFHIEVSVCLFTKIVFISFL